MDLIIVRHGKAETLLNKPDGSDFDRSLTDDGVSKVRSLAKILKELTGLQGYNYIKIIASTSARTMQTAGNIADILNVKDVTASDKLYHGDYYSILPEIISENSEADCIILVGHSPDVFFLTTSLCEVKLDFKKGSFACISLNDDKTSGNLKYFVSSEMADRIPSQNNNVIDFNLNKKLSLGISVGDVKSEMSEISSIFYEACESFKSNFEDPESIHEMRIHIRRLLSLLDFIQQDLTIDSYKHVNKSLRGVNSDLSIIRDLDQFIFYLNQTDIPDYFKNMAISQRKGHEDELLYRINTDTFHNIENILSSLIWINSDDKMKHIDGYIKDLLLEIQKNRKKICPDKQRQLHSIRIIGKKVKNMIEIFPDAISEKIILMDNDVKKFVRHLGNVNDYYNSIKILDILYKLSFKPEVELYENIDQEYNELKSHFKKLTKDEFKKIGKINRFEK
ncbi:MAG: CHAD domain-containing protein [Proteocatella sp.]